uniref:dTMP kinase n=1 Tax=Capra hircus TaxID=9925 RepID=A0A8C2QRU9_CAPHI
MWRKKATRSGVLQRGQHVQRVGTSGHDDDPCLEHPNPERSTEIGKLLSSYLEKKSEVEDHSVHLLFSANRWEHVPLMKEKLSQGITLVVDRYAFSGVAFTSAKENFSLDWCKQPDVGLPKPDLVVFLQLQLAEAAARGEFGRERYESGPFQQRALQRFQQLLADPSLPWKVSAARALELVQEGPPPGQGRGVGAAVQQLMHAWVQHGTSQALSVVPALGRAGQGPPPSPWPPPLLWSPAHLQPP